MNPLAWRDEIFLLTSEIFFRLYLSAVILTILNFFVYG